jgi:hypothetical protein
MTERIEGEPARRERSPNVADERRVAAMPEIEETPASVDDKEKTPAATGYLGMQAGIFFTVVVLAVIFVIAIIVFAVTR